MSEKQRRRKYINGSFRMKIWFKFKKKCAICHVITCLFKPKRFLADVVQGHVDHIIPFSKGGLCNEDNFRWLCARCNLSRGNR